MTVYRTSGNDNPRLSTSSSAKRGLQPVTPAGMLASFGLDPARLALRDGFRKFLAGKAPATADVYSMIQKLKLELDGNATKAASVMVAIQKFHPDFVPVLDCDPDEFFMDFWTAATVSGLEVCALWTEPSADFLTELLLNPDCSICTLDFSRMDSTSKSASKSIAGSTSVTTWQGYPAEWLDRKFIGPGVRELQLDSDPLFGEDEKRELQTILAQGKIDCIGLTAPTSAEHLRLSQAVQHANSHGGRVHEVRLRGQCDSRSAPEILKILLGSKSLLSVTLPDWRWLNCVELATLQNWLDTGSVGFLDFAIVPVQTADAAAHLDKMAEIGPLLMRNRQLTAVHVKSTFISFSMELFNGLDIEELQKANLTHHDCDAMRKLNKTVYLRARKFTDTRQAAINGYALVSHAPASNTSPGAKIDELIREAANPRLAELGLWLAQGLKNSSVTSRDQAALEAALNVKLGAAIDAAFDYAETHRNEPQDTDLAEGQRIIWTLFEPNSKTTIASLAQGLSEALDGFVPRDERMSFKEQLLLAMNRAIWRAFEGTVVN